MNRPQQDPPSCVLGAAPASASASMALALLREQDRLLTARAAAAELVRREERASALRIAAVARMQAQAQAAAVVEHNRQQAAIIDRQLSSRQVILEALALANKPINASSAAALPSLSSQALPFANSPLFDEITFGKLPPPAIAPPAAIATPLFRRQQLQIDGSSFPQKAAPAVEPIVTEKKAAVAAAKEAKRVPVKAKKPRKAPKKGKDRKPHKRKPLDMPRRALSAYNLFFAEERRRILAEQTGEALPNHQQQQQGETLQPPGVVLDMSRTKARARPHRKSHGSIGFKDLTKTIAQRWKALPAERVAHFQRLSEEDQARQRVAMEEYHRRQKKRDAENAETLLQMARGSGGEADKHM